MKTLSKTFAVFMLLIIGWDLISENFSIPISVLYLLVAVQFALGGAPDLKEGDKGIAYFSLFASGVLFTLLILESVRVY